MTEINENMSRFYFPKIEPKVRLVDPVALAVAMILAPIVVGLLGAPLMLIPTFAAVMGGPVFVVVGTPVLLMYLRKNEATSLDFALLALFTNAVLVGGLFILNQLDSRSNAAALLVWAWFSFLFAPIWAALAGKIYLDLRRPFYAQTIHI